MFNDLLTRNAYLAIRFLICSYSQITSRMNKVLFMPVQQIFNPCHTHSMNTLYRQEWYTKIELIYGQERSSLRSLLFPYFFPFNIFPTFSKLQEKGASTQLPSGYPCVTRLSRQAFIDKFIRDMMEPLHIRTPVLESHPMTKIAGFPVYLKLENVQPVASFKIRGLGNLCQKVGQ